MYTSKMIVLLLTLFSLLLPGQASDVWASTLIYGRGGDSNTLDPPATSQSEAIKVITTVFDTLVAFSDVSVAPVPALAKSWTTSNDKTRWTFKLREGVLFHDGTPLNSAAVKYSINRMIDPNHPGYRKEFPYGDFFESIREIKTPDLYTVIFVLRFPYAPFLQNLCLPAASIISPAAMEKYGDAFGKHPVGTGPFVFESWGDGSTIALRRNINYWGTGPFVDRLIFKTISNDKERLIALKAGAIHMMDSFSFSVIDEFYKDQNLRLHSDRGINVGYLALNTTRKPLDNVLVRRAINMAVNKKRLIKLFCQDLAIPAVTPIPPGEWAHNSSIKDYEYNPERARELLREAGYPGGFSLTLLQSPLSRSYIPFPQKFARFTKASLEAIGIKIEVIAYSWEEFWKKANMGEYDIITSGWTGDNGDPDNFFYSLFHSKNTVPPNVMNYAFYNNPQLDELLIRAQSTLDVDERTRLYHSIQTIIHQDAPWVPLAHGKVLIAARSNVKNIHLIPILPHVRLNTVQITSNE